MWCDSFLVSVGATWPWVLWHSILCALLIPKITCGGNYGFTPVVLPVRDPVLQICISFADDRHSPQSFRNLKDQNDVFKHIVFYYHRMSVKSAVRFRDI